jgi:alpha-beta hydrolase superfamily lysophospholipase
MGEHTGVYLPFVAYFAPRGAAIYAHDHRGFGRSEGRRGHVRRYERYVDDLRPLVERARAENPDRPLVLVGHSMGGTIALLFTLRHPDLLDLAIYSAPALILALPVALWRRVLGRIMSRVYPIYTDVAALKPALLTRDLELQQATRDDALRHARTTARLYTEMFVRAPREVLARAGELRVPFLVLHGLDDPIIAVESSRRLYASATVPGRAMHLYPGLRHEPFREIERAAVFADVAAWLSAQGVELDAEPHPVPAS